MPTTALRRGCIAIPQIQPERAVVPQHAPHLAEDGHDVLDVQLRRRLEAEAAVPGRAVETGAAMMRRECLSASIVLGPAIPNRLHFLLGVLDGRGATIYFPPLVRARRIPAPDQDRKSTRLN